MGAQGWHKAKNKAEVTSMRKQRVDGKGAANLVGVWFSWAEKGFPEQ
jgi:hypothetical protein